MTSSAIKVAEVAQSKETEKIVNAEGKTIELESLATILPDPGAALESTFPFPLSRRGLAMISKCRV